MQRQDDLEVVGVAADYDELLAGAEAAAPQVLVTDIRMPPTFQREGIEAAKELRKRHPGTGVVVLSQYDDPEYAIALLAEGSSGYGYLLKDRIAEGDQRSLDGEKPAQLGRRVKLPHRPQRGHRFAVERAEHPPVPVFARGGDHRPLRLAAQPGEVLVAVQVGSLPEPLAGAGVAAADASRLPRARREEKAIASSSSSSLTSWSSS